ncbi:MAG: transglutaminase-like domain-containing protein, partial [bacterium]
IEQQHLVLTSEQARLIRPLLDQKYREAITATWMRWQPDSKTQLEEALTLLAEFQLGRLYPAKLRTTLDTLADEYDARYTSRDPLYLAEFLFQGYGLRGAEQEEYYDPLHSNLLYVIETRRGIPISLACIYILVGERLGLKIEGCNFPGHFLAVASTRKEKVIVDCFNGGLFIDSESLATAHSQITREDILRMQCNAHVIIARVLRNLINAYQQAGDEPNVVTMSELLARLEPGTE